MDSKAGRGSLWQELRYTLWFPVYFLIYLAMERLFPTIQWATQTPLDRLFPFCEAFVIPYCLWYPLLILVGVYLLWADVPAYRRYMRFLAATFFLSELVWLLLPNGQALRPAVMPRENLLSVLVAMIYRADTCTNVFPSVHVVGAIGAMLAVWDCPKLCQNHRRVCWAVSILTVLICLSTLFIKQHTVLDVLSGILLSMAVAVPVYQHRLSPLRLTLKRA